MGVFTPQLVDPRFVTSEGEAEAFLVIFWAGEVNNSSSREYLVKDGDIRSVLDWSDARLDQGSCEIFAVIGGLAVRISHKSASSGSTTTAD